MREFKTLPIELLQPGFYQPRKTFDKKALQELADSITSQGLIEPLVIRKIDDSHYEIIAGERRWRAAMMAGLCELPCLIGTYTDQQTAAITLVENIQRQDLNLLEEAQGYQRLHSEFSFSQDEVASLVGKSRSHVANILRLLTLSKNIQEQLRNNQLSLGHARALVGLSPKQQIYLANLVTKNHWSVRRLENEVRLSKQEISPAPIKDQDVLHLQTRLAERIGAPVEISNDQSQGGGWLKIKFFDNDTLAGLLERLGLSYD
jgi:ParB family chromosome partitioning protein